MPYWRRHYYVFLEGNIAVLKEIQDDLLLRRRLSESDGVFLGDAG